MSSSLFDLLSRQTPTLQVKKGLIILDLQNDFLSRSEGKLAVRDTGFLKPLSDLVESFREYGDVIWVRSQFESTRPINGPDAGGDNVVAGGSSGREIEMESTEDAESSQRKRRKSKSTASCSSHNNGESDEELFLSRTAKREPCCLPQSSGVEYFPAILPMIRQDKDLQMIKTHYSAFSSTSLLLTLRGKLITELYICGCITNLSVYATAMDAARYGIKVRLVDDCLGYRRQANHDIAIAQLQDFMEASTMTSTHIIDSLRGPSATERHDQVAFDKTAQMQNEMAAMEADSDDSDEENEEVKPIPSSLFGRRIVTQLARPSNKYSSHVLAARQRKAGSEHAQSSSHHRGNTTEPTGPYSNGGTNGGRQRSSDIPTPEHSSSSGNRSKLASHDSSPWLDLMSSTPPASFAQNKHLALAAIASDTTTSPSSVAEIEEMVQHAELEETPVRLGTMTGRPLFGEDKEEESASSRILYNLLPPELADVVFDRMYEEVDWQKMFHLVGEVPRLVSCQGTIDDDGSQPIYRHPSDHTLPLQEWTATVDMVRKAAEEAVGHSLNHVLIQLYRSGTDYISEHSDKTLDIVPGSNIVNVSFGARRTMRLRTKRGTYTGGPNGDRITYRVPTPHNSMIVMSLKTNAQYLHSITADKRPRCELVDSEMAYGGQRISCTFRQIGTFISKDSDLIWGQGAVGKTRQEAREVINGDASESEKMVRAFGAENAASTIEWQQIYGQGFDVLHLKAIQGVRAARPETSEAPQ